MKKTLILGYGNADRQDDGVAWHILNHLAVRLERPASLSPDEGFSTDGSSAAAGGDPGAVSPSFGVEPLSGQNPELLFVLQLTPEMAETISEFDRVCFVDAHTGNIPGEVNLSPVEPEFQASPFTHHLTPASLLALSTALYNKRPETVLVSVRGYEFGFDRSLSPQTAQHSEEAVVKIWEWLGKPDDEGEGTR